MADVEAIRDHFARTVSADAPVVGRFAPSPSGDLHLGNLRTALLAWLMARHAGGRFVMRVEDLDRVQEGAAQRQLEHLAELGIDWDGEVLYQSHRVDAYLNEVRNLADAGLTYECFCTRKEIQAAPSAPHAAPGAYPGTCRDLTPAQREARRAERPGAIRLKTTTHRYTVDDYYTGEYTSDVDDFVLVRNDGTAAYNLASVVDDHHQGITQIVRGDDLLPSAPRQAYLANLLGFAAPRYAHVPLALNAQGKRLAKRDGAVTLPQLREHGVSDAHVMELIGASIPVRPLSHAGGTRMPQTAAEMLEVFDPDAISTEPWVVTDPLKEGTTPFEETLG